MDSELAGRVTPDDCFWALEGSGASRKLVLTLTKKKNGSWRALTKDEESDLPEKSTLDEDFDVMTLEHDDDDPERVEEQERNEKILEARYAKLKSEKGLNHEETLQTFFALFDNCIQLYRLNKLSDYLEDVVPVCRKRDDKYKLKAIQALSFVRWKQSKFREALPLMLEMEEILGKGAALCENIAHTYNSLGDYDNAEEYFRQALKFIEQESGLNRGNRGGVLLGLGLVRDRLGKHKEALPVVQKAYEFYKERANGAPASLQAKAAISCAKINCKLGNLVKAEAYIKEAVQMYEVTCGATSPLTASAYHELGRCLWAQRKRDEAQKALKRAYEIESMKDAWDLVTLLEIHNLLMDTHLKETANIERTKFKEYFKTVEYIVHRVKRELPQDGNAAVYYKAAAELKSWGGQYTEAKELFEMAIPLLKKETSTDCSGLIQTCNEMLGFCERNLQGTQKSPMDFSIPDKSVAQAEEDISEGVKIEELPDDDDDDTGDFKGPNGADGDDGVQFEEIEFEEGCRNVEPSDFSQVVKLSQAVGPSQISHGCEILLSDKATFSNYLRGAGASLCQALVRGSGSQEEVLAVALCSSDGIFGHVLQLLCSPQAKDKRKLLMQTCVQKCNEKGLEALHASVNAKNDDGFFAGLDKWSQCKDVKFFSINLGEGSRKASTSKASASAAAAGSAYPQASSGAAASSSVAPKDPKLKRDDYDAWNKLNVEKTLVAEDGLDPSIVPDMQKAAEDFGVGALDPCAKLTTYSWDQSDKFVTIYVTLEGAATYPAESVQVIFKPKGVLLTVDEASGKKRWFKIPNLCKDINTGDSTKKIKTDSIALKLKKVAPGENWSDLTDDKDRYKERREYRINHGDLKGATTEELLADMYQNATDEERAGLRDAMRVNREKREADGRKS